MPARILDQKRSYLSLGSTLGDRLNWLRQALHLLSATDGICLEQVSSGYETEPVGLTEQPTFLNIVVSIRTTLEPEALLAACQAVETSLGRERKIRWGPRNIDIDILTYAGCRRSDARLTLPHPRMRERAFVMVPLRELVTGQVAEKPGVRLLLRGWFLPKSCQRRENSLE